MGEDLSVIGNSDGKCMYLSEDLLLPGCVLDVCKIILERRDDWNSGSLLSHNLLYI